MNIKYLPEKLFFKGVAKTQSLWLARQGQGVLAFNNQDGGLSLTVWSDREKVKTYIKSENVHKDLELIEFPILNFEITFMNNPNITEFQLNPDTTSPKVLVICKEEFQQNLERIKGET